MDSTSSCVFTAAVAGFVFCKKRPIRAEKSPGSNAFVLASIHNIGFSVKKIVNDIRFQIAKKARKNIFWYVHSDLHVFYAIFRRKNCRNFRLTSDTLRCILSAYYFKRQRRRGNTAVSLPLFIRKRHTPPKKRRREDGIPERIASEQLKEILQHWNRCGY